MAENERGSGPRKEWKLKKGLDAFGNMFGLNLCFVIGCLPVITIGASLAATYATAIRLQENEEETILSCYIHEFKRNFKQATLGFLALLVVVAVLLAEWILVNTQTGAISLFYTIVFYLELLFTSLVLAFFFPMIARYQTTLKQAAKNSILLSVGYVWSWLKITVAWVAPVAFSIIYPVIFLYTWYLWLLLIFGMIIWGTSHSIRFVFNQNAEALKQSEEEAAEEAKKKEAERLQKEEARKLLEDAEHPGKPTERLREEGDKKLEDSVEEAVPAWSADAGVKKKQVLSGQNKNSQNKAGQNKERQNNQKKKQQNRYYPAANKNKNKKK